MIGAIDLKNCKECLHFEACSKWTDFPRQVGFPVCRKYRTQSEGELNNAEEVKILAEKLIAYTPLIDIQYDGFYKVAEAVIALGYKNV